MDAWKRRQDQVRRRATVVPPERSDSSEKNIVPCWPGLKNPTHRFVESVFRSRLGPRTGWEQ